ncbi:hypothetical protein K01M1_33750 [Vibrio alginolyticus]|uniref:hypothetical protein n=1 Tax=Vibrio alginolyticus TaxID=663 RepID=UPI000A293EBA|nr:hypothetical protein [Vibrio alginolyticus]ARP00214.1 hypothetical protein K01M1_33750 [Vibrio alginolyticus]
MILHKQTGKNVKKLMPKLYASYLHYMQLPLCFLLRSDITTNIGANFENQTFNGKWAAVLLAGCGSDSDPEVKRYSVQAYDPAVIGMKVQAVCGGETYDAIENTTNYEGMVGKARFENINVVNAPGDCAFVLTHTEDSKDASNGKPITSDYKIPQGLAQADSLVTGSPFTTLVANSLKDGEVYSSDIAEKVFENLVSISMQVVKQLTKSFVIQNL